MKNAAKRRACRPSLTPSYAHCYDLDKDGHRCAHRITVLRNWATVDFVTTDGREFSPEINGNILSQAALLGLLRYENAQDLTEVMVGLQQVMGKVQPINAGALIHDGMGTLDHEIRKGILDLMIDPGATMQDVAAVEVVRALDPQLNKTILDATSELRAAVDEEVAKGVPDEEREWRWSITGFTKMLKARMAMGAGQ